MTPDEERERRRQISRKFYQQNRAAVLTLQRQRRRDPVVGEKIRARERERVTNLTPEERERRAALNRDWYRRNPRTAEANASAHMKHRYGLTPEGKAAMAADQDGLCYLCGEPLPDENRKVHVDHDHSCCRGSRSCGACIRGLTCNDCNTGIGLFGDDPDRMRRVADALEMANARVRAPDSADVQVHS